jgi:hypothetical protein
MVEYNQLADRTYVETVKKHPDCTSKAERETASR